MNARSDLSQLERILLVVPLLGGAAFGLLPLVAPGWLGQLGGFSGQDHYIYRLAGASTLGYAVALALAIMQGSWSAVRLVVIAVLTFNLASIYACVREILTNSDKFAAYLILVTSILLVALSAWMLYSHRGTPQPQPDVAQWVVYMLMAATAAAAVFGLWPLLLPGNLAEVFGYNGTDAFVYRQAGAATLGYAVMGVFELRSRNWHEMRLPAVMAIVFNGVSFLSSVWSLTRSTDPKLLPIIVGAASLAFTVGIGLALQRNGK
jgi:hypothetical protein